MHPTATRHKRRAARSEPILARQAKLFVDETPGAQICLSAPHTAILDAERDYLCAWLRSRLEDGLWLPREESALSVTPAQRRQIVRLAHTARRLGLQVWPPRTRQQQRQSEVA